MNAEQINMAHKQINEDGLEVTRINTTNERERERAIRTKGSKAIFQFRLLLSLSHNSVKEALPMQKGRI